ncbi:MAG: hypothetical protein V1725_06780 [archaeon]
MNYLKNIVLATLGAAALGVTLSSCCESGSTTAKPKVAKLTVLPITVSETSKGDWASISAIVNVEGKQMLAQGYTNRILPNSAALSLIEQKIAEKDTMTVYGHFENSYGRRIIAIDVLEAYGYHIEFKK